MNPDPKSILSALCQVAPIVDTGVKNMPILQEDSDEDSSTRKKRHSKSPLHSAKRVKTNPESDDDPEGKRTISLTLTHACCCTASFLI